MGYQGLNIKLFQNPRIIPVTWEEAHKRTVAFVLHMIFHEAYGWLQCDEEFQNR